MVSQPEQPVYDPGVYELEVTDPVQGGIGGVANLPLLNLANRTAYLKQKLDSLINGTLIPPTVAPLNGPAFTGSTTAPNVRPGDDSTLIANTDFVQTARAGLAVVPVGGVSSVTLNQDQWGVGILVLTGTLTANVSVIFPTKTGMWQVANRATGAFDVTCKTPAGTGVIVAQVTPYVGLWGDGVNIYRQESPAVQAFANSQSFFSTANFTAPAGVTRVKVRLWGGGGAGGAAFGASAYGGGGAGGGYAEGFINVVPGGVYLITVGKGGIPSANAGGAGDITVIAGIISATGGGGGNGSGGGATAGGVGGVGSGGTIGVQGGPGSFGYPAGTTNVCGVGGWAFGTSLGVPTVATGSGSVSGQPGTFPGGGGSGGVDGGTGIAGGGNGGNGLAVLEW